MNFEYYQRHGHVLYAEFAEAVAGILRIAVGQNDNLHLQNIECRAKESASLLRKLKNGTATNDTPIADIAKDLAGCRLIFYTNKDVHDFGQSSILRENFTIDYDRSKIHYPNSQENEEEFFVSENWVVTLNDARNALPEYRRFAGLRCEIQVQTVLDHTWAAMAHDTIYKPIIDVGFGAAKMETIRKRLRKIWQEYLQPAGYEFDKIASDFAQLRAGKAIFDSDALGMIRSCTDRNCLWDAVNRFANYVLPNYDNDNYIAAAAEIIDVLAEAAIRALPMQHVPRILFHREFPGIESSEVIGKICSIFQRGGLLYNAPERMFDALLAMRISVRTDEERKPIDELAQHFARHERLIWERVGPLIQSKIVSKVEELDDANFLKSAPIVMIMLREVLSSTVTNVSLTAPNTISHSIGLVPVTDNLKNIRHAALLQLQRLHVLIIDEDEQARVRKIMFVAGELPHEANSTPQLVEVVLDNLVYVIKFCTGLVPQLGLETRRQLEVAVYHKYLCYHTLPPSAPENREIVAAHVRFLKRIALCRMALEANPEFEAYKLLVGYDSVSPAMWTKTDFDYRQNSEERSLGIYELIESVSAATSELWLARLEKFAETRSNDLASFLGLQEFINKLAKAQPEILLGWLPKLSDRLANWLRAMLNALSENGHSTKIDALIENWIAEDRHLTEIAWYLQFAEEFRFDLLAAITQKGLTANNEIILYNIAAAAARQSAKHPSGLFDQIFLPAARALSEGKNFIWVEFYAWNTVGLLRGLTREHVQHLLKLMVNMSNFSWAGELMLAVIAKEHPTAVINFIGSRYQHKSVTGDYGYEPLPNLFHQLSNPLSIVPGEIVAATRKWFEADPLLAQFRGGRLIVQVFPTLEQSLSSLLYSHIQESRQGIEFVLSVLSAYEGQEFLHPILQEIVKHLPKKDALLEVVDGVIQSSGVLIGENARLELLEVNRAQVAKWPEANEEIRAFKESFDKRIKNQIAAERRRVAQSAASGKLDFEGI